MEVMNELGFFCTKRTVLALKTKTIYEKREAPNFDVAAQGGGRSDDDANAQIL